MLSATKRILGSAAANRVFFNATLKAAVAVPSRNYLPGRNWEYLGGISLRDGIADVPASAPSIYSSRREKCGVIVLNRSKFNNSLNKESYITLLKNALNFESNEHLGSVLVMSSSPKVFCSGIDYKSCLFESNGNNFTERLLATKRREYDLLNQIHISDIPIVSIIDGKATADGAALGLLSRFPIVTENASISFPEVKYGFFPDGGSTKLLSSLGGLGMYLALTGTSLRGADLVTYGLSRTFIERSSLESVFEEATKNHRRRLQDVEKLLLRETMPLPAPDATSLERFDAVSRLFNPCFHADASVADTLQRLSEDGSPFAQETYRRICEGSDAVTLQLVWRSVVEAAKLSVHGVLKRDYQLCVRLLREETGKEFLHGLQARFIDRVREEKTAEVTEAAVEKANALFAPVPEAELSLSKSFHYDIPMFRGEAEGNEEAFVETNETKYDWERIEREMYHLEGEKGKKDGLGTHRSFVHPVTGLTHPVPMEWEEDMRMARNQRRLQREEQMGRECEIILDSMPPTKYEK